MSDVNTPDPDFDALAEARSYIAALVTERDQVQAELARVRPVVDAVRAVKAGASGWIYDSPIGRLFDALAALDGTRLR